MTPHPERQKIVSWINEAVLSGARKEEACKILGYSARTVERWVNEGEVSTDQRPEARRPPPSNKLTVEERELILSVCNEEAYASLPPSQIVPKLADEGRYIASESTFYRVLKAANQLHHRGRSKAARKNRVPSTHLALRPNELWSWDVSYMPTRTRGLFFYLYMVLDIFSRKIVGWEVHEQETGKLAAELMERSVLSEQCFKEPLILHSDNGSPMKSYTLQSKLVELGITPSHSRPRVSNDNAYSESLFRTLKYCPQWPSQGFDDIESARHWVMKFVRWYNEDHCHSGINFVTPAQRHDGQDQKILAKRDEIYQQAKEKHPERWSGKTRNWSRVEEVALNPEKSTEKLAA